MLTFARHTVLVVFLTLLTQLGGIAWLIALCFKRRLLVFVLSYILLSVSALFLAPQFGREPISCFSSGTYRMKSAFFCAANRQYVTPELKAVLSDVSSSMSAKFPDTTLLILDANFPFISGFPLLPHLSHSDGRKVDIAFFYQENNRFLPNVTKSPIGYFAFEKGPTDCQDRALTLRWDLAWLQRFWPEYHLEPKRMSTALKLLSNNARVGKVFLEPHLKSRFNLHGSKIRFQGCRAARHDDHIHIQL
ncbi:hypothetical protein [Planktotalea sp.]|uniref:hypothetical protein n=1 Tax=Planktotalea sp. TaxID=2029877 RepID=UPI003D6AA9FF